MAVLVPDEYICSAGVRIEGNSFGGIDQEHSVLWSPVACGRSVLVEVVRSALAYRGTAGDGCRE